MEGKTLTYNHCSFFLMALIAFMVKLEPHVLPHKHVHRTGRRHICLQHIIGTLAALCACHFCAENPLEIRLRPLGPDLIDMCHVRVLFQIIIFHQHSPGIFKLVYHEHVVHNFVTANAHSPPVSETLSGYVSHDDLL